MARSMESARSSTQSGSSSTPEHPFLQWLGRILCKSHDYLTQYDDNRIYLRCLNCGHETPGWEVGKERKRGKATQSVPQDLRHRATV